MQSTIMEKFSSDQKACINASVLCWLATTSIDLQPNVSPKEIFTHYQDKYLLIAHIASPKTIANIRQNSKVCVSFIEIFKQKGYKMYGNALLVDPKDGGFPELLIPLERLTQGKFPIVTIIKVEVTACFEILAPSYQFFSDTTEEEQITSALKQYGVKKEI